MRTLGMQTLVVMAMVVRLTTSFASKLWTQHPLPASFLSFSLPLCPSRGLFLSLCGVGVESIALADFGGVFHAPLKLPFTEEERDATRRQRERVGGPAGPS